MSFPRYPSYKDSGVEWLGEIPEHWETVQSRRLFRVRNEGAQDSDQQLTASQKYGIIFQSDFMELEGRRVVQIITGTDSLRHAEPNDFVISLRSFQGGLEWCKLHGSITFHYVVLVPIKAVHEPFFAHLFKSIAYIQALRSTTNLIRDGQDLRYSHFVQVDLPIIPKAEQAAIAAFLDRETAKIDELVAEQRRLIELLKEKRQAVISHAVTKGLNPDAPMKPSGIEWLGDVPEHWTPKFLKFELDLVTSGSRGWAQYFADEGELFFRITNIRREHLEPSLDDVQCVIPPQGAEGERSRIRPGDILVSITADLGSVTVAPQCLEGAYVSQHVCLSRPGVNLCPRWAGYALKADCSKVQFEASGYGGTKIQLSLGDVRNIRVAVPPMPEQETIAARLDDECGRFDALVAEAQHAIDLLQERRSALISAAVTGQIDVRGLVELQAA